MALMLCQDRLHYALPHVNPFSFTIRQCLQRCCTMLSALFSTAAEIDVLSFRNNHRSTFCLLLCPDPLEHPLTRKISITLKRTLFFLSHFFLALHHQKQLIQSLTTMHLIAPSYHQPKPVVSFGELNPECTVRLKHVIGKVLALKSTKLAIAQIKYNKAIQGHFHLRQSTSDRHQPNFELRSAPSPDAVEFAQKYCEEVDIMDVKIDAQVCLSYGSLPKYRQIYA